MVIKADQLLNKSSGKLAMQKAQQEKMVSGASVNIVLTKKSIKNVDIIKTNVVKIESILKGTLALDKKQLDDKKRDASKKRKEKIETKLETKPNAESGKISMPAAPRMGILDFIKNFIGNVLLGYFAVRLIKHLPKIVPIVKFLGNAADFIIDVGGKLLNGLVSFIDAGYKAYDATRGFIKNIGGENFAKGFDKFLGAIDTALFLTTALAGAMAVEALTGDGGDPNIKPKPGTGGRPKVTTSGGGGAGKPDIRNPLRQKPKVTTGGGSKLRLPKGLKARGGLLGLVFLIPDLIESGMLVSQGRGKDGIRTLISAVSGVAAGMAAYAGVIAGAAALGITGVGIPAAIALAVSGFGASYLAGAAAYNLTEAGLRKMGLVDNDPKTGKPYTYRSGGITRGGKSQRGARRTISKGSRGKYKRVVARKPGEIEIKPGADVGGEDKIFGIFPNPLKAAQRMVDAVNPFGVVKTAGEDLGKTDYFGPILAITSKITLGQKPSQRDYENVGLGINMLIAKGIQDKQLKGGVVAAFAEGGLVDPDVLSAAETGGDISNWVAKTFQGEIESNAQKTLRMIRENAEKKKTETTETPPSPEIEMETMTTGGGTADTSLNPHRRAFLDTLAYAEGTSNYPNTGYNTMFTGKQFAEYKDHPRKIQVSGRYRSDAAGRYQFLSTTWDGLGLSDFSPANQDRGALKLLAPHVITAIDKGDFATAFHGARKTWASLPGAGYGQPEKKMKTLVGYANNRLEKYQKGQIGKPVDEPTEGLGSLPGGVTSQQIKTGPSQYIGGSTAYHIDTKFHKSLGMGNMVSSMDKLANAYSARGRKIEFSNAGVSGEVYNPKASSKEKQSLLQRAIDAHSHSRFMRAEGFLPFDYYNPKKNENRFGKSVEGSEILLPTFGGKVDVGTKYGGYGKSAEIFSGNKMVAMTGHGDVRYEKGGETLNGPHLAMVGEKGREIVIDNDSVESHPQVKEMLLAINQASNYQGVLNAIRQYAPYDAMSPQTIVIPSPSTPEEDEYDSGMSGGVAFMPIGGGGDDPFATLYQGG